MPAKVDRERCVGCGACEASCPVGAIAVDEEGKATVEEDMCVSCGACEAGCPCNAITVE